MDFIRQSFFYEKFKCAQNRLKWILNTKKSMIDFFIRKILTDEIDEIILSPSEVRSDDMDEIILSPS